MDAYAHFLVSLVASLFFILVFYTPNKLTHVLIGSLVGTLVDLDHFFVLLCTNFEETIKRFMALDVFGLYHSMANCDNIGSKYFIWHSSTILVSCGLALVFTHSGHINHKLLGLIVLVLILHFFTDFGGGLL